MRKPIIDWGQFWYRGISNPQTLFIRHPLGCGFISQSFCLGHIQFLLGYQKTHLLMSIPTLPSYRFHDTTQLRVSFPPQQRLGRFRKGFCIRALPSSLYISIQCLLNRLGLTPYQYAKPTPQISYEANQQTPPPHMKSRPLFWLPLPPDLSGQGQGQGQIKKGNAIKHCPFNLCVAPPNPNHLYSLTNSVVELHL